MPGAYAIEENLVLIMSQPEHLKSSSNNSPLHPKGIITYFFLVVSIKIYNSPPHHHQKIGDRGFFSCEKNPG
jgi:hypothetical protein